MTADARYFFHLIQTRSPIRNRKPITAFNARALASLASVAGTALNKRLNVVLEAISSALESGTSEDVAESIDEAIHAIMGAIEDAEGLHVLMTQLLEW